MSNDLNNWADENIFQTFLGTGAKDDKGREIGWIVGMNDSLDGKEFSAWVQNGRSEKGEFKDFGVMQRSRRFNTKEAARKWAYATAKERIANYLSKAC